MTESSAPEPTAGPASAPAPAARAAPARDRAAPVVALLLAFALPYLFLGLGRGSLENSDDALNATIVQQMAAGQGLLDPTYQGAAELAKPHLFSLLAAGAVRGLGASELALRLVPALAILATALLVLALARRLGAGAGGALVAAVLFLAMQAPLEASRHVREDALLAAWLAGATLLHVRARTAPRAWLGWGLLAGLAALTKGAVAAVLPLAALLDLGLRARPALRTRWPWLGAAVALAVAAPWHILQTVRHGRGFWDDYLLRNVLDRAGAGIYGHTGGLYYLGELARDPMVCGVAALGVALLALAAVRGRRPPGALAPVVLAAAVPLAALSLVATRFPHYILPVAAPLAALAGAGYGGAVRALRRPAAAGALAAAIGAAAFALHPHVLRPDYAPDHKALALEARRRLAPGDTLYVFDLYHVAARFYGDRRTVLLTGSRRFFDELVSSRLLARSPDTVRFVTREDVARLGAGPSPFCCLTRAASWRVVAADAARLLPTPPSLEALQSGSLVLFCLRH